MRFIGKQYNKQSTLDAGARTFLLWNGLGGYCSMCADFSVNRADDGILVAAVKAPNERITLVHRLTERLQTEGREFLLSSQNFADKMPAEDGFSRLETYCLDDIPVWQYRAGRITVERTCAMAYGENTTAVVYSLRNDTAEPCTFTVTPYLKFAPKETALTQKKEFTLTDRRITADGYTLYVHTGGKMSPFADWQELHYYADEADGRPDCGFAGSCCNISITVSGQSADVLKIVFSTEEKVDSADAIMQAEQKRLCELKESCAFSDPVAKKLVVSADSYIVKRDSTSQKTILAGYPLFSDWGRDTMIALPGCCLSTARFADAKSILQTFLAYEKDGLVPNLFPEGDQAPMYNTADAALLLIDAVWQYYQRTRDAAFVQEAWPVMERIISAYRCGTRHNIGMDSDGLIHAGKDLDQVTWMDVRIENILPTPRHGKPVEINAYWYNALKIMEMLTPIASAESKDFATLAERVKESFLKAFYMPQKGYLKDVLSGTGADEQIRCNQIWALSMSFTMLPHEWEIKVMKTIREHLLTPCGLRTLSPKDTQYHGFYGGSQTKRDMAYHQGTTWVFPLGAYCRAYLRIFGKDSIPEVKEQLSNISAMLEEGCAGQLPEIYDGDAPKKGKGCYAQAWSVGEILRAYEMLEQMENDL